MEVYIIFMASCVIYKYLLNLGIPQCTRSKIFVERIMMLVRPSSGLESKIIIPLC